MIRTYLSIPYLGQDDAGEPTRNWAHLTFSPPDGKPVHRRKIKRAVRKWIWLQLGRCIHPEEMHMLLKRVQYFDQEGNKVDPYN